MYRKVFMGDIIFVLLIIGYVASWIYYFQYRRRRSQPLTEEDFAEIERMIEEYRVKSKENTIK